MVRCCSISCQNSRNPFIGLFEICVTCLMYGVGLTERGVYFKIWAILFTDFYVLLILDSTLFMCWFICIVLIHPCGQRYFELMSLSLQTSHIKQKEYFLNESISTNHLGTALKQLKSLEVIGIHL